MHRFTEKDFGSAAVVTWIFFHAVLDYNTKVGACARINFIELQLLFSITHPDSGASFLCTMPAHRAVSV